MTACPILEAEANERQLKESRSKQGAELTSGRGSFDYEIWMRRQNRRDEGDTQCVSSQRRLLSLVRSLARLAAYRDHNGGASR